MKAAPNGPRQPIVIEDEHFDAYHRELLKAVSAVRATANVENAAPEPAHSATAVRPRSYVEWSDPEDRALSFLFRIGASVASIGEALQRDRGAIRSRLDKNGKKGAEY